MSCVSSVLDGARRPIAHAAIGVLAVATLSGCPDPLPPPDVAPIPPSELHATAVGTDQVDLSWTDNSSNEAGFRIERREGSAPFGSIHEVSAGTTEYSDSGLITGTTYSYRVRSFNGEGQSDPTAAVEVEAGSPQSGVPTPPSALHGTAVGENRIDLSWTDNSANEDGFRIERKQGSGSFAPIHDVPAGTTDYSDEGLTASTLYSYRVRAFNAAGASDAPETIDVQTGAPAQAIPAAPSNLHGTAVGENRIDLTWTDNSNNEAGFRIERRQGSEGFVSYQEVIAGTTQYSDTGLPAGTTYSYRVRAYNDAGVSAATAIVDVQTGTATQSVPAAPSGMQGTAAGDSRIDLSWTDNSSNEDGFRIERRQGSAAFATLAEVAAGTTSYFDLGLTPSTSYSYRVRAFNGAGTSDPSNVVTVTTGASPPAVPSTPTGLEVTSVQTSEVHLSWVDASSNETAFRVERAAGGTGSFTEIAVLPANATSFVDSVSYDTPLQYRVRASNTAGSSGYSNVASTRSLVSFSQQLYPVLASVTCAGSGCHNATAAQGGLTLNGPVDATYAEVHDELSPVHQVPRVDTATPCDSLLLKKPSRRGCDGSLQNHSGGTLWTTTSEAYQMVLRWIGQGAQNN